MLCLAYKGVSDLFRIEDQSLYITRGDTGYLNVEIEGYDAESEDTLTLTVRKNVTDQNPAFSISAAIGECLVIQPADTKSLECGRYYYDIQLDTAHNEVFTIVEKSLFKITEEVTR